VREFESVQVALRLQNLMAGRPQAFRDGERKAQRPESDVCRI
jgi:hypothetical protein